MKDLPKSGMTRTGAQHNAAFSMLNAWLLCSAPNKCVALVGELMKWRSNVCIIFGEFLEVALEPQK